MADIALYREKYGEWTDDCIEYAPGLLTYPQKSPVWLKNRAEVYAFWFEQYARKPFSELSILDVGCLEGGLSYHFARLGATATGIEIRDKNLGKCSFLNAVFPDLPMRFLKANMYDLRVETFGRFDGILMAGVLYHIDAPQIIPTLQKLRAMTDVLIVDTHTSTKILETYDIPQQSLSLYGRSVQEHRHEDDLRVRDERLWSSYDNDYSFWLTENSLANALIASGFDWVSKPLSPTVPWYWKDRGVWIAGTFASTVRPNIPPLPDPDPRVTEHEQLIYAVHNIPNPSTRKI